MTHGQMDSAFHHFHKLLGRRQQIDTPDSQLVDRFAACRDEGAFETLLHRHAGLVWGVCRRMLKDSHLAEDAFQATFLVLAREATSIRKRQSVSSWLYGVAYRLASRVRSDSTRRQQCEGRMRAANEPDPMTDIIRRELRPLLDEELQALPEKYRAPLILCHLQGKTHEQAAQELGWPVGTMSRRLDKVRELLRQRLTLRGVRVSAALLPVTLANESTTAIPAGLVATTLRNSYSVCFGHNGRERAGLCFRGYDCGGTDQRRRHHEAEDSRGELDWPRHRDRNRNIGGACDDWGAGSLGHWLS